MILTIDVGNTHTVIGLFEKKKLVGSWRVTSFVSRTEDEFGLMIKNFCHEAGVPLKKINSIGISSVVPSLTSTMDRMSKKYFNIVPIIISHSLSLGIKILYDDPQSVGADRICNAVAAYSNYGEAVIVVDFGTATTFDVINKNGEYLGGIISLGIETMASELHRRAALLPKVNLVFPETVIGKTTTHAMQSGILYGVLDSMETMIRRISRELDDYPIVIATGGFSELMSKHSKVINKHEPNLVLEGIRIITEKNQPRKK